jgi:hypothetical protein
MIKWLMRTNQQYQTNAKYCMEIPTFDRKRKFKLKSKINLRSEIYSQQAQIDIGVK